MNQNESSKNWNVWTVDQDFYCATFPIAPYGYSQICRVVFLKICL